MLNKVACSFHFATSPTSYSSILQSIVYKNKKKNIFLKYNLNISKKSSTFAAKLINITNN